MQNLLTAIYGKTTGQALSTYVGDRIYLDEAPQNVVLPYIVFFIVSDVPEYTFPAATVKGNLEDVLIQFSLFSDDESGTEIQTMYNNLKTLFDDCTLTIPPTGTAIDTLVWMKRENLTTMIEESVKHWAVDYSVLTERI